MSSKVDPSSERRGEEVADVGGGEEEEDAIFGQ